MHVPDGFLDVPTSVATGVMAVGFVALASYRARHELDTHGPALPGLAAAFIFAGQMVNFPVGIGTSGHLMGAALAAALVGPWIAILVMTVIFIVQALMFADGGITALGTNVLLMGVIAVLVASLIQRLVRAFLPARTTSTVFAAAIAAFLSVPIAALAFTGLYLVGGAVALPPGPLVVTMVGWHLVIGIGEAIITAVVLGAVIATRPDVVYVARPLLEGYSPASQETATPRSTRSIVSIGLAISLIIGGGVSLLASANPDGLEYAAESLGFLDTATDSAATTSPFAEYSFLGDSAVGSSLAGLVGVLLTLAITLAVAMVLRVKRIRTSDPGASV
jgi:cobalt/nickel transport system permease protein